MNRALNVLEEIFTDKINVLNIAVPISPLNIVAAKEVCILMNYDVHLVYEERWKEIQVYEMNSDSVRPINDSEVISESTPLIEVLEMLCNKPQVFIKVKRNISHVVTRADLEKIPVRIWLYGMISILEVELKDSIRKYVPEWKLLLSPGRIAKAEGLYKMKVSRNEEIDLLGCTQLSDVGVIISKSLDQFKHIFPARYSRNMILSEIKNINFLRDALAHNQKLGLEWSEIYRLMQLVTLIIKKI